MKPPVLHNRLVENGGGGGVAKSVLGLNPVNAGTLAFAAGTFGTRVQLDYDTSTVNYFTISSGLTGLNYVACEVHWKPGFAYNHNASAQTIFQIGDTIAGSAGDRISMYYNGNTDTFTLTVRDNAANKCGYVWASNFQFAANTEYHFLFVMDKDAGVGHYIKWYIDGVRKTHTGAPYGDATWNMTGGTYLFATIKGWWTENGVCDAVFSNVKIHNIVFADLITAIGEHRNYERYGLNDQAIAA